MDWKQFAAAVIASVAWPMAVVFLVVLLKKPLSSLLPLIRSFKYKDFHLDLGEKLEAVKDAVSAEDTSEPLPEAPQTAIALARLSPRAAVLHAWIEVEKQLYELAEKIGVPADRSPLATARLLRGADAINAVTLETLFKLFQIRSDAVHLTDRDVTFEEAVTMADMCQWLERRLKYENISYQPMSSTV